MNRVTERDIELEFKQIIAGEKIIKVKRESLLKLYADLGVLAKVLEDQDRSHVRWQIFWAVWGFMTGSWVMEWWLLI